MTDPSAELPAMLQFPRLAARDLEGGARMLPAGFTGSSNLVVVAFRREQQSMVDSWISWFDTISAAHPGLRCYEVPVIATRWSPGRRFIDGGMAQAVPEEAARRRTLTVYTDVRRVTDALAIYDTQTVTVLLVDGDGRVLWRTTGPAREPATDGTARDPDRCRRARRRSRRRTAGRAVRVRIRASVPSDARARGVTPGTAHVTLTPERLVARFGPWTCATAIANVGDVCRTGPYRWFKAIGRAGRSSIAV